MRRASPEGLARHREQQKQRQVLQHGPEARGGGFDQVRHVSQVTGGELTVDILNVLYLRD